MAKPNESDMPPKLAKNAAIGYLPYTNSLAKLAGQWLDLAGYQYSRQTF